MTQPSPESGLPGLRARIDDLDGRILTLLRERAGIVVEVGKAKREKGIPIYAPHREKEVLDRLLAMDHRPLADRSVEAIWRELMSGSFGLELPLRVGFLGPRGTFSHLAAVRHFGSSVELAELEGIDAVFEEVQKGRCHHGLVPYENAIGGAILDTLDAFQSFSVRICAETMILVKQCLLGSGPPEGIRRIASRGEVFAQCRRWLQRRFPGVQLVPMSSTAAAAEEALRDPSTAAIGGALAGQVFGLNVLFEGIEDRPNNITRFLVLGRESAQPSGDDRTTLMFTTADRPGALVDVLVAFRDEGLNLGHLDKRPSQRENFSYTFFVDVNAHERDERVQRAMARAQAHVASIQVLGSYPRATRVL
jgi:chorismate mutase/prephenate dehydratase